MATETPAAETEISEFSFGELGLATRNHGMPLEGLRYDVTPIGMHYLLIHFDIPETDEATWSVEVGGRVGRPLVLTMDDVRARPSMTLAVTMECAGNGRARLSPRANSQPWRDEAIGTAEWTGTPLRPILDEAGLKPDAVEVVFTGADHGIQHEVEHDYQRSLTIAEAQRDDVLLAYEINGQPLPPQHGFPLRLLVPGWYGMTSVKWLTKIEAVSAPFDGVQMWAYQLRQEEEDEGTPVTRIQPRALMVPPGFPDFPARARVMEAGPGRLQGRAWSGVAPIERVEVSTDGGATWADAALGPVPASPYAWRLWTFEWSAPPGEHELVVRATDATGSTQPLDPPWNLHGLSNNMAQRVPVTVR
jgi:DMSO/TMAO reductase YedYZ molybdopterin-dependent catalytic subunit